MFCRILFQQVFEVRGAGAQNHLVGLGVLALMISLHALQHATGNKGYLGGNGDVAEALLISQVLERGATMLVWKSFQRRQNCWSSVILSKRLCGSAIDADLVE